MNFAGSLCSRCEGQCCKVGFIVDVTPTDAIYNDLEYVHKYVDLNSGIEKRNMKSNGDGYTCIALAEDGRCKIWDRRPQACRDFAVDSERCKAIRKEYGRP